MVRLLMSSFGVVFIVGTSFREDIIFCVSEGADSIDILFVKQVGRSMLV